MKYGEDDLRDAFFKPIRGKATRRTVDLLATALLGTSTRIRARALQARAHRDSLPLRAFVTVFLDLIAMGTASLHAVGALMPSA